MIGDWMGSQYTGVGKRWDLFLFLDHDGRYQRVVRTEPDSEQHDVGHWEYDESRKVLRLLPDTPTDEDRRSAGWDVLSVAGCESSNVMLVLRMIILASRNLPVVLYRVHHRDRGYGTDWQKRLSS